MANQGTPLQEIYGTLTEREREIVRWTIQRMTNKAIASRIGISLKTVSTHMSHIFTKLKINRRLELLLYRLTEHGESIE